MKKLSTPFGLSVASLICGAVLLGLQAWLYATGIDKKNLIVTGHAAIFLSGIVTVAALLLLLPGACLCSRHCRFRPGNAGILGEVTAAVAMLLCGLELLQNRGQIFSVVAGIAGLLAGLCCAVSASRAWKRLRPRLLLRIPEILFFMLLLVCRYQFWSAEPQFYSYVFQLLALVCLMLAVYQKTALKFTQSSARAYLLFSRGAISFCLAAIPGSGQGVFFAAMALWLLTDGCVIPEEEPGHEAA